MRPLRRYLWVLVAALLIPSVAEAQQGLDLQRFHPTTGGGRDVVNIYGGRLLPHLGWSAGAYATYARDPLMAHPPDGDSVPLVENFLQVDALAAIGFGGRFEVGVNVPVTVVASGERPEGFPAIEPGAGLGDIRLVPRVGLLDQAGPLSLAVVGVVSLPTGDERALRGQGGVGFHPQLAAGVEIGDQTHFAANLGFEFVSERKLADVRYGRAGTIGLGLEQSISRDVSLAVTADAAISTDFDTESSPIEALAALRWTPGTDNVVDIAGGPGLGEGVAAPMFRLVAGYVRYSGDAPPAARMADVEEEKEPASPVSAEIGEPGDTDGDGIVDVDDECVELAEDQDGFEDDDGCPDPDNDGDGIADEDDECPEERERYNGIEDEDGCPDKGEVKVVVTETHVKVDERIYFNHGEATIRPQSHSILEQVAGTLRSHPEIKLIEIHGHADATGTRAYNERLSKERAQAVRDFLIEHGVDPKRLEARGFGDDAPIAPNTTEEGRQKNRRVDFVIRRSE